MAASLDRTHEAVSVVTAKGGLRITPCAGLRLIASESPTKESWSHRVALCLPSQSCAMNRRSVLTEIGADKDALRIEDRAGVLFDLGLGTLQIDICIRSRDPELVTTLRGCTGTSVFAPGSGAMRTIMAANPHRVFISRVGRPRCSNRSRRPAAKARTDRIPTSCRNCWRMAARMRRPSRCPSTVCHAHISIRRIRCATSSGGHAHFAATIMTLSSFCSRAMATLNALHSSGG
jgi:hypothetical protein